MKNYIDYFREQEQYLFWRFTQGRRLLRFKDIHHGKGCFIIGCGPSLNSIDLPPLKDYYTFGLNKIYFLFDKVDLDLSYHVAVNPYVIEQSVTKFESLPCPTFLNFKFAKGEVKNLDHVYSLYLGGPYTFQENLINRVYHGFNVTFVALQIAFYMGFREVFLIGIDHHYEALGKPNEKQILKVKDINHFDPRYFSGMEWQLPDLEASELSYQLAGFFYKRDGRKIFDATKNGKLNVFPKISYEEALSRCEKK